MSRLLVIALVAACGGSSPKHETPPPPPPGGDPSCPVEVPGTSVTVEDTATGAALVFVTTSDVAAVRKRANALATMHTKHDGPDTAMGMMIGTASTAVESDTETGAKITFTASKPDDVSALQSELRMHANHLSSGSCKMAM